MLNEKTRTDVVRRIVDYYQYRQDDCVGDMLAFATLNELREEMGLDFGDATIDDIFHIYIDVMREVEGDTFTVTKEGETFEL